MKFLNGNFQIWKKKTFQKTIFPKHFWEYLQGKKNLITNSLNPPLDPQVFILKNVKSKAKKKLLTSAFFLSISTQVGVLWKKKDNKINKFVNLSKKIEKKKINIIIISELKRKTFNSILIINFFSYLKVFSKLEAWTKKLFKSTFFFVMTTTVFFVAVR